METVRYPIVSRKITTRQVEGKPLLQVFPNLKEGATNGCVGCVPRASSRVWWSSAGRSLIFTRCRTLGAGDVMYARIHTSPTSPNSGVTSIACMALCNARTRAWKRGEGGRKGKRGKKYVWNILQTWISQASAEFDPGWSLIAIEVRVECIVRPVAQRKQPAASCRRRKRLRDPLWKITHRHRYFRVRLQKKKKKKKPTRRQIRSYRCLFRRILPQNIDPA